MDVTIFPRKLSGSIAAIDSKSHAHRLLTALAMALFCSADSNVYALNTGKKFSDISREIITDMSEDLSATMSCLTALLSQKSPELYCGESGSTLRFLLPLAMAVQSCSPHTSVHFATFYGKGKLPERPLEPLDSELISHGAAIERPVHTAQRDKCTDQQLILSAFLPEGNELSGGDYEMPGHISSQYITGLMMALPLIREDSRIIVTSELQSRAYIDITLAVLRDFGIQIETEEKIPGMPVYCIKGGQKYVFPQKELQTGPSQNTRASIVIKPEGDWSNAAFWLSASALGSDIRISGLNDASPQGDKAISGILENFSHRRNSNSIHPLIIDAGNIPDLIPIISVVAALVPGQTQITNAGRLRIKESDRLKTTCAMLSALDADISETADGLIINGKKQLAGGTVDGAGDHRIVMAAAIAATCCSEPVIIYGAQAAAKSYPAFFEHYEKLGGELSFTRHGGGNISLD